MKGLLKTITETNQSIPYPKEVHFCQHHCRAQKNILNYMWRNLTITLAVPESQTSHPGCFTPIWVFFLCGLWLSHHLSFLFPSDLKGMQNNTDPRNRFGLNLILSNREFKQLKRVTESICSKNMGISEKNSVRIRGGKSSCSPLFTFTLPLLLLPFSFPFPSLLEAAFHSPFLCTPPPAASPLPRRLPLFPHAGFFPCLHHRACVALHANSQAWDHRLQV